MHSRWFFARSGLAAVLALTAIVLSVALSSGAGSRAANVAPSATSETAGEPGAGSPIAPFQLGEVPGNSAAAPLPTDAPAAVRGLATLPSCGAEVLFEEDVDLSPIPTAPGPTTDPEANQQAGDCLISAWQNHRPAVLATSAISDEADQVYSIYRLPGDGTVQVIVRVLSHTDRTVSWTQRTCRQLSIQQGAVTPADCDSEAPMN
jgi:hypothetical protein